MPTAARHVARAEGVDDRGIFAQLAGLVAWKRGSGIEALALMKQSLSRAEYGSYHVNIGLLYLILRAPARAIEHLEKAVAINPGLVRAHAALAMILTLNGQWARAEAAARTFRSALPKESTHIDLCLMAATYAQGKPAEGAFDFGSLAADPAHDLPDLLDRLPKVDFSGVRLPKHDGPVVLVCCDPRYLSEHVVPFLWSVAEAGCDCPVHVHVYDPVPDSVALLRKVAGRIRPLPVAFTYERVDWNAYRRSRTYYASVRFCRLYQLSLHYDRPMIMVDADVLMRKHPRLVAGLADPALEVGLLYRPTEPMWDCFVAQLSYFKPTPAARAFLARVALFIADNIIKRTDRWYVDQVALLVAHDALSDRSAIALLDDADISRKFAGHEVFWTVSLKQKTEQNRYNDYKNRLLQTYGDARSLLAAD